jgi:hypothetical protein
MLTVLLLLLLVQRMLLQLVQLLHWWDVNPGPAYSSGQRDAECSTHQSSTQMFQRVRHVAGGVKMVMHLLHGSSAWSVGQQRAPTRHTHDRL